MGSSAFEIEPCPEGERVAAFIDLDNTVLRGFSAFSLGRDLTLTGRLGWWDLPEALLEALAGLRDGDGFRGMALVARLLAGLREEILVAMGERLFAAEYRDRIYPEARRLVEAHRAHGHTVVIASAATPYQAEPVARELGVEHVVCTRFETRGGRLTGRVVQPTCRGRGKLSAVRRFAHAHDVDLAQSFFYSDGSEDLPLLRAVGKPRPTNPNERLAAVAQRRGWPTLRFESPHVRGLRDVAQTLLSGGLPSLADWSARAAEERERALYRIARWSGRGSH